MPGSGRAFQKLRGWGGKPARDLLDTVTLSTGACGQAGFPAWQGQGWGEGRSRNIGSGQHFQEEEGKREQRLKRGDVVIIVAFLGEGHLRTINY